MCARNDAPSSAIGATGSGVAAPDCAPDPYRPFRSVGTVLALLVLCSIALEFARNALQPSDRDFVSFWGAARLVLSGTPSAAYDRAVLHALQAQNVTFSGQEMPFPYPPAFLLVLLPFALLPFAAAMATWTVATLVGWVAVIRRMFPRSGWLAIGFPPVYANAAIGQNGFFTASLFTGGLLLLPRRPFTAGLVLGGLVLKPQLALLLPVALIAGRQWRAIAGAAASATAIMLAGLVLFGIETNRAWLAQAPLYGAIARDGLVGWQKLASVYAAARQLGVPADAALLAHVAVALAAAVIVWRSWRSDWDLLGKASVLAAATMLASPYLFFYDFVILTLPLLYLAERRASPPLLTALWLLPLPIIGIAAVYGPVNLSPLLPLALLALLIGKPATSAPLMRHLTV